MPTASLNTWVAWGAAHSTEPPLPLPPNFALAMYAVGDFRAEGANGRAKEQVAATPPVPRRWGRPPGSRNKKTLADLTAAAAATSSIAVVPTTNVPAPGPTAPPVAHALALNLASYTLVEGFRCFLIPVTAGATRLPPPFQVLQDDRKFRHFPGGDMGGVWLAAAIRGGDCQGPGGAELHPRQVVVVLHRLWHAGGLLPPILAPVRDIQVLHPHRRHQLPSSLPCSQDGNGSTPVVPLSMQISSTGGVRILGVGREPFV
jgi:hypothetical protein